MTMKGSNCASVLRNANAILAARQRTEKELAQEREMLRVTLASIGDAVISTDVEGRIQIFNGVAELLTGWKQTEAAGKFVADVFCLSNALTGSPTESPLRASLPPLKRLSLPIEPFLLPARGRNVPSTARPPLFGTMRAACSVQCSCFGITRLESRRLLPKTNEPGLPPCADVATAWTGTK